MNDTKTEAIEQQCISLTDRQKMGWLWLGQNNPVTLARQGFTTIILGEYNVF